MKLNYIVIANTICLFIKRAQFIKQREKNVEHHSFETQYIKHLLKKQDVKHKKRKAYQLNVRVLIQGTGNILFIIVSSKF